MSNLVDEEKLDLKFKLQNVEDFSLHDQHFYKSRFLNVIFLPFKAEKDINFNSFHGSFVVGTVNLDKG